MFRISFWFIPVLVLTLCTARPDGAFDFDYPLIKVEGGKFTMGQPNPDIGGRGVSADECAHPVTVRDFAIGKYEVTQKQWLAVMGENPSWSPRGCDSCPVTGVSWQDIRSFIKKLNNLTGDAYRLPTEAEWEFAARGGNNSKGYIYAGSNNWKEVAWKKWESYVVGQRKPNELGIYDMSGNAWEWCQDQYGPYPGCKVPSKKEKEHVCRGGSYRSDPEQLRVTARIRNGRDAGLQVTGFRLVKGR